MHTTALRLPLLATSALCALALCTAPLVAGDGHEQHAAHVHGQAELLLAIDGQVLDMEFRSPAMDIVGFEHAPGNPAQRMAVADAMAMLGQPDRLFELPAAAGCQLKGSEVDSPLAEDDHDEHGHGHHDDEEHAHQGHDHDHGKHEQAHSDFVAHYHYECRDTGKLKQVDVNIFKLFPGTESIKAQAISAHGQHASELSPDHPTLAL